MSSILDALTSRLGPDTIGALASNIGADPASTKQGIDAALPLLLGALARNASTPQGADALHVALNRDHDGSILNDVIGAVTSGAAGSMGGGILGHVLGTSKPSVEQGISRISGLDPNQVAQLLATLAPLLMGVLGKQARGNGLDASALGSLLGLQHQQSSAASPHRSLLSSLLDRNGDGNVADDVGKIGMGMLGSLFGGSNGSERQ